MKLSCPVMQVCVLSLAIASVPAPTAGYIPNKITINNFIPNKYLGKYSQSSQPNIIPGIQKQGFENQHVHQFNGGGHNNRKLCRYSHCSDFMDFDDPIEMVYAGYSDLPIGMKYSFVELPDSLMDTTLFVGNLNQFVTDTMLSDLFQQASRLSTVASVVARRPNTNSLQYGFVVFATAEEKEEAILHFNGTILQGKELRVEAIRTYGPRVKVPEQLVTFTVGSVKKTRDGKVNTMRRVTTTDQPAKKRGHGSRKVSHRLNESERAAFERSERVGFVTLAGTGYRRGRKSSSLGNAHREWCDARGKPQIILCKASGGRPRDNVIVDLSPLRLGALSTGDTLLDDSLTKWKMDILTAAENSGMTLVVDYVEDNTETIRGEDDDDDDDESMLSHGVNGASWSTDPIWKLPAISIGVFEGERSNAKAMAKELAILWDTMELKQDLRSGGGERRDGGGSKKRRDIGGKRGGRTKSKTLKSHRRNKSW